MFCRELQRIALDPFGLGRPHHLGLGDVPWVKIATIHTPRWQALIITLWAWPSYI